MPTFFKTPFAADGDKTTIPSVTSDGQISLERGYGPDYQRNPLKDNAARRIERDKLNHLFYIITEAIGEIQRYGSAAWEEAKRPYAKGSTAMAGDDTWISLVGSNNDRPGITGSWRSLSNPPSPDDGFDPEDYIPKSEMQIIIEGINNRIKNFSSHEIGDIYPVARHTLVTGEFICNGDTIPVKGISGALLKGLPESYKTAWGIKEIGTQRIKLPMIFTKQDTNDQITVPVFAGTPGLNRTDLTYYDVSKIPPVAPDIAKQHLEAKFLPIIWLEDSNANTTDGLTLLFEGTDNIGLGTDTTIRIQQLRFAVYQNGRPYSDNTGLAATVLTSLSLKNGSGTVVPHGSAVTRVVPGNEFVIITVTLGTAVTVATMDVNISATLPSNSPTIPTVTATCTVTNERLV